MAKGRRANGGGSIYPNSKGGYTAQFRVGKDDNGKTIFKRKSFKTKRECEAWLEEMKKKYNGLSLTEFSQLSIAELAQKWFDYKHNERKLKPKSLDRIESTMNTHILSAIGDYKLCDVTPGIIKKKIFDKMVGEKNLSKSSVKKAYDDLMSIDSRVKVITPEDFNARVLYGNFHSYGHKDFMTIQMKRIGFNGNAECFEEPILTVYGMMMTGLVTVADSGTHTTHIYTLNPKLAGFMCGKAAVKTAIEDTKENVCNIKKNSITCFEIIPQRANNTWVYDCQPAYYKYKKEQTVAYTLSILYLRNKIISQLLSGILDIQYFDIKTHTVRDITTSLSQSGLSNIMEAKVYSRIMNEIINEKTMASLKLPVLHSDKSEMAEIFIPSIMSYSYQTAGLLLGKKFDPFNKSK